MDLFKNKEGTLRALWSLPEMSAELRREMRQALLDHNFDPGPRSRRLEKEARAALGLYDTLQRQRDTSYVWEFGLILSRAVRAGPSQNALGAKVDEWMSVSRGMPIGGYNQTSCLRAMRTFSLWPHPPEFCQFMLPHWNHVLETRMGLKRLTNLYKYGLIGADEMANEG